MVGIYKIISPTNKIYIGQSTNIENRWIKYKCLDCKVQIKLYRSFTAVILPSTISNSGLSSTAVIVLLSVTM